MTNCASFCTKSAGFCFNKKRRFSPIKLYLYIKPLRKELFRNGLRALPLGIPVAQTLLIKLRLGEFIRSLSEVEVTDVGW